MLNELTLTDIIRAHFPDVQAVYLYGSHGKNQQTESSDIDLAVLLPPSRAKQAGSLALTDLHIALQKTTGRVVDLVNLRRVATAFQHEVIHSARLIGAYDENAVAEFEMYTMSLYQKLNEERREILEEFYRTKRAYPV